jgi:hypothetical protein
MVERYIQRKIEKTKDRDREGGRGGEFFNERKKVVQIDRQREI